MDNITHTMAGAVLARAGLDRGGTLPMATSTLMIAANLPDIDVFVLFLGSYIGLALRRGWTHGPIAIVVLPLVLTGLVLAWHRFVRRRGERRASLTPVAAGATLLIAFIGVVSHPMLDWLNTYGVRLLMPFSRDWFYGDAVFIIDPWLWLFLGAALVRWRRTRRRVQVFAAVAAAYVIMMIGASKVAESIARRAAESAGTAGIEEVMYQPAPAQPHRANLIVATREAYTLGTFDWFTGGNRVTLHPDRVPRGDWNTGEVRRAMGDPRVRDYLVWSRFPFVRTELTAKGTAVFFGDARFTNGRSASGALRGVTVVVAR
ncbi:MAG TPA: metal-dependent hydrolase [Gemmatimonadaceae bacterium]|nr:metal-dependent hydrolase [Gemmatimonadaceae bacterium]